MQTYNLSLKQKSNNKHISFMHFMASFLFIIMGAIMWALPSKLTRDHNIVLSILGISYLLIGMTLFFLIIKKNKKLYKNKKLNNTYRIIEIVLLLPTLIYFLLQKWIPPAVYSAIGIVGIIYAMYIENKKENEIVLEINDKGIIMPNTKAKFVPWNEIQRLLLKHQIITVDCYNNKLYQYEILKDSYQFNPSDLELFAQINITKNKGKLIDNDW